MLLWYCLAMLYIIASPIGNLDDISQRALKTFESVDAILCEDTRQTSKLLARYNIRKTLISLHEHSSQEKISCLIDDMAKGRNYAYVSDGGTPNLSDPGGRLVEAANSKKITVSPIVGPSALTALISVAPFPCSDFRFIGFFPKKKGRQTLAKELLAVKAPVFFFESPKRVRKTIKLLSERIPNKKLLIGRELTKIYEQILVLDLSAVNEDNINDIPEKGEFVLAIF